MSQTKAQLIDPVDGTIVNADINASAAIAGSKISPAFTSNITGTGDLTLSSGGSDRLKMTHAGGGQFVIKNPSAAALSFGTNNQNNELHISNGGNVGIGAAGSVALHIHNAAPTIRFTDTDTSRFSQIYAVDGNLRFDADNNNEQSSTHIAFRTDNSERMRIDDAGRLLLGTTTEGYSTADNFTISDTSGDCGMTIRSGTSSQSAIAFSDATSGNGEYAGQVSYYHSTDEMIINANASQIVKIHDEHFNIFAAEGTIRMNFGFQNGLGGELSIYDQAGSQKTRITGSANTNHFFNNGGNVGIGTTSPGHKLHLVGTDTAYGGSVAVGPIIELEDSAGRKSQFIAPGAVGEAGAGTPTNHDFTLFTNNTERIRIKNAGNVGIGTASPSVKLHVSGGDGLLVERSSGTSIAGFKHSGASAMNVYFQNSGSTNHPSVGSNNQDMTFGTDNNERMRIDDDGRVMIGTTTAVGTNTPNLQVKAASPASGFDNHIYLEGSETNGNANTGAQIGFGGHDGTTARNWAAISGFKTNGSSGNTSSYLSFKTRRSGVSGINEMWKITAMGSFLARDNKESAIGREWTNGSVPAGQTRDHTDNGRLNFNGIGGNGGGWFGCLSISSQDQNPSGAFILAGVHGQGFNSYDTILSNFDSGISVTFSGGTVSIQNTSSETIYYSMNVIHMGTGNTTYLGR